MRKGRFAALLIPSTAMGLWVACLPSEPEILPVTPPAPEAGTPDASICDMNASFENRGRVFDAPLKQDRRGATLTNEEKTIYFGFATDGLSGLHYPSKLYVAERNDRNEKFDGGRPMAGAVNNLPGQDYPRFSSDEQLLFFAGHLDGGPPDGSPEGWNHPYLYVATKGDSGTYGTPQRLKAPLNGGTVNFNPFFRTFPGGGELWFAHCSHPGGCIRADAGYFAIHRSYLLHEQFSAGNAFSPPVAIEEVDGPNENEYSPVVSADGLELLFSRAGAIFTSHKSGDKWSTPRPIGLGGVYREAPTWLSPDHCRLYFESQTDNPPPPTIVDIYMAERPKPGP